MNVLLVASGVNRCVRILICLERVEDANIVLSVPHTVWVSGSNTGSGVKNIVHNIHVLMRERDSDSDYLMHILQLGLSIRALFPYHLPTSPPNRKRGLCVCGGGGGRP